MTSKCANIECSNFAEWAWQPFGPDDEPIKAFTVLGWHYRGFPVLKVCDECHKDIQDKNNPMTPTIMVFKVRGKNMYWNSLQKLFQEPPF